MNSNSAVRKNDYLIVWFVVMYKTSTCSTECLQITSICKCATDSFFIKIDSTVTMCTGCLLHRRVTVYICWQLFRHVTQKLNEQCNHAGYGTKISWEDNVNTMATDALTRHVIRTSVALVLIMRGYLDLVIPEQNSITCSFYVSRNVYKKVRTRFVFLTTNLSSYG